MDEAPGDQHTSPVEHGDGGLAIGSPDPAVQQLAVERRVGDEPLERVPQRPGAWADGQGGLAERCKNHTGALWAPSPAEGTG